MAVCITGMHRSGTSMVARMLNLCGLYLGAENDLKVASHDNAKGYWEHESFVQLNDQILNVLGGAWDYPPARAIDWIDDERLADARCNATGLLQHFKGHEPWGWKDPRSSLTLQFWQSLIPHPKVVICLRHPLEVALSLRRRRPAVFTTGLIGWRIYALLQSASKTVWSKSDSLQISLSAWRAVNLLSGKNKAESFHNHERRHQYGRLDHLLKWRRRMPLSYRAGLQLWKAYNESLLRTAPQPERIITHYNSYFSNPKKEIRRVAEFLRLPVSDADLERACEWAAKGLRHHRFTLADLQDYVSSEYVALYQSLCAEAEYDDRE